MICLMALANCVVSILDLIKRDVDPKLLAQVDFITSEDQKSEKQVSLYMPSESADDPAVEHLADGGWQKYDSLVFMTNWQQSMYNLFLGIPYSAGIVMPNAIETFVTTKKNEDDINLLFVGDPRNGLDVAFNAFQKISPRNPNVKLYVYSDFSVFGNLKTKANKSNLKFCDSVRGHPMVMFTTIDKNAIGMQGKIPVLDKCHILLLPNHFPETSYTTLIECMSAEMMCIHTSYSSLPETSLGMTAMYGHTEDLEAHVNKFYQELENAINLYNRTSVRRKYMTDLAQNKIVVDNVYSWEKRCRQWNDLLKNLLTTK